MKKTDQLKKRKFSLEDKDNALRYYVMGLNLNEISKLLDVSVRTLEGWRKDFHWTTKKESKQKEKKALELFEVNKMTIKEIASFFNKSVPTINRYLKDARQQQTANK